MEQAERGDLQKAQDPEQRLESHTTKALRTIEQIPISFFGMVKKYEAVVKAAAIQKLEQAGGSFQKRIHTINISKDRAKKRLLLLKAEKIVLQDLERLLFAEYNRKEQEYQQDAEFARMFGSRDPDVFPENNNQQYQKKAIAALKARLDAQLAAEKDPELEKEWEFAQAREQKIVEKLSKNGARPDEIAMAFKGLPDVSYLEVLIKRCLPDKHVQSCYIDIARQLRNAKGSQYARALRPDEDNAPLKERIQQLFREPPVGKPVLFEVEGTRFRASYAFQRGGAIGFQKEGWEGTNETGSFILIDREGHLHYRDEAGKFHTVTIGDGRNGFLRNYASSELNKPKSHS